MLHDITNIPNSKEMCAVVFKMGKKQDINETKIEDINFVAFQFIKYNLRLLSDYI